MNPPDPPLDSRPTGLIKALLVDMDPAARLLELFLGDKPNFDKKAAGKSAKAIHPAPEPAADPSGGGQTSPHAS
jgi:hypothetical protein